MQVEPARSRWRSVTDYVDRTFRPLAEQKGLEFEIERRRGPADGHSNRRAAAAADPEEPALERVQVHRRGLGRRCASGRPGRRRASRTRRSTGADACSASRSRHRHRHRARQAAADLRGVPAGRRHHQPQVRRHGPRPDDQPRDRAPARRRDPGRERRSGKGSMFTLYLPERFTAPPTSAGRGAQPAAMSSRPSWPARDQRPPSPDPPVSDGRSTTIAPTSAGRSRAAGRRGRRVVRALYA